ncbi:RNA pseudouridine synthase [Rhodoferax sp.]|uniref:RNA pseudouridine synthase n=1 Tax=Rhodoferax sp. TaxID=50421 RepID=UPI0027199F2C|nr:RNA pseudouridine synthase [Rhodoferax sp.]MDO9195833.1 RNA pseudouridine synthase [Rhodoferax sp.]
MSPNKKPAPRAPHAPIPGERLAKRVAEMVPCSRREAEQYIAGGWVSVDGQVVEEPQFKVLNQKVELDKNASLMDVTQVTLLLHKPPGYDDGDDEEDDEDEPRARARAPSKAPKKARQLLTPTNRATDDASGIRLLKRHFADLTSPVPLEVGAGGLLVFTQDWRVARKLTEDAGVIEHEVIVEIEGEIAPDTLQRLNQGLSSDGHPLPRVKVSVNSANEGKSKLRFAVKGTHPGLIAYLCERVGLNILSMKRIRIGRVSLTTLPIGQWRYLLPHERF